MQNKTKAIIILSISLLSFAVGRWASPTKVVTKTVTVEKIVTVKDYTKDQHNNKTTVTTIKPNGEKIITTTDNTEIKIDSKNKTIGSKQSANESTKTWDTSKVTISALGGWDFSKNSPIYGASITKPILGPITMGVFGLTSGSLGVSLGLQF